jgi:hypothetical protein
MTTAIVAMFGFYYYAQHNIPGLFGRKKSVDLYLNIMGNMGYILLLGPKMKFACEYQIL